MLTSSRQLEDGGWLEIHQLGYRHDSQNELCDNKIFELNDRFCEAMFRMGRSIGVAGYLERLLKDLGFEDVRRETIRVPFGTWTKDPRYVSRTNLHRSMLTCRKKMMGMVRQQEFEEGLAGMVLEPFSSGLRWTRAEIETFLMEVRQSLRRGRPQLFSDL